MTANDADRSFDPNDPLPFTKRDCPYWWFKRVTARGKPNKQFPNGKPLDGYGCWCKKYRGKVYRFLWGWKKDVGTKEDLVGAMHAWLDVKKNINANNSTHGKIVYEKIGNGRLVSRFVPDKIAPSNLQIAENISQFLKVVAASQRSKGRLGNLKYNLSFFQAFVEDDKQSVAIINEDLVENYYSYIGSKTNKNGKPWSTTTMNSVFQSFKQFVAYLAGKKKLPNPPFNIAKLHFEVFVREIVVIPNKDLVKLYHASTTRTKMFLMLGLFCGFTGKDISDLKKSEFKGNRIVRKRSKNQRRGNAPTVNRRLPKTLVKLIERFRNKDENEPRLFLGQNGNPLQTQVVNENGLLVKACSVKSAWFRPQQETKCRYSFTKLRKTGATKMRERFPDLVDTYLGNTTKGTKKHYAGLPVKKFDRATRWMISHYLKLFRENQDKEI